MLGKTGDGECLARAERKGEGGIRQRGGWEGGEKGKSSQEMVAHQLYISTLKNWGAGGRCCKEQQGTPLPKLMDVDRKSRASGSPSPQGPRGLGEGLRKERRVLTLYHSGVGDIDHDGSALRGLLSVGGDGGEVGLAPADGTTGLQQRLLAGVRAAAVLLRQAACLPPGGLRCCLRGAPLLGGPDQLGIASRDPICPAGGMWEKKRCEKIRGEDKELWEPRGALPGYQPDGLLACLWLPLNQRLRCSHIPVPVPILRPLRGAGLLQAQLLAG